MYSIRKIKYSKDQNIEKLCGLETLWQNKKNIININKNQQGLVSDM
jgi:hypothetical protein